MRELQQVFTPISNKQLTNIRAVEDIWRMLPQSDLQTEHLFHAGMYTRTIHLKTDMLMTNVLIKRATLVIVHGSLLVLDGDSWVRFDGYNVLPAAANRKQVFATITACSMSMIFPTAAKTVAEAEAEFTDEMNLLASHRDEKHDVVTVTGE